VAPATAGKRVLAERVAGGGPGYLVRDALGAAAPGVGPAAALLRCRGAALVDLGERRPGFVKVVALTRGVAEAALRGLAEAHDQRVGWAIYTADAASPAAGAFDGVIEIYSDPAAAGRVHDRVAAAVGALTADARTGIYAEVERP
jgi:hypothetical protein